MIAYIIPCSGAKRDTPQAARDLYAGAMFTNTLAAALTMAADDDALVLIMSAKYGLVRLDDVLTPYDQRIDAPGAIDAATLQQQIASLGLDWQDDVYSMLPSKYFKVLDDALRPLDMYALNVYEGARGIGDQRHINTLAVAGLAFALKARMALERAEKAKARARRRHALMPLRRR